jgi:hypothetical protein
MVFLLCRRECQGPGSGTGSAADVAHGGGNIARSLDAFERCGHFSQKTRKNPSFEAFSYHVGRPAARRARLPHGRLVMGITWITGGGHATN